MVKHELRINYTSGKVETLKHFTRAMFDMKITNLLRDKSVKSFELVKHD